MHPHRLKVSDEVQSVTLGAQNFPVVNREATIPVTECCSEASQKDWLFDGITKKYEPR